MVTNKFGKNAGPYTLAVPGANTVGTSEIANLGVATADIAAKAVTAAKLGSDVAGTGLSGGDGAAVALNLNGLSAATVDVAADSIGIIDANDTNASRKEAIADLVTAMAGDGLADASGVLSVDLDEFGDATLDPAADTLIFIDESAAGDPGKLESVADFVGEIAGSGLAAASGVLAASGIGIAHMANDDKASIFYIGGEIDFGESNAITVDLGAIGSKATLLGGYWTVTEAVANGDATSVVKLGTATGGGATISSDLTITLVNTADGQSNTVGMMRAVLPNGTTSVDMASTAHLWLDCADDVAGTRSAGKVKVFLILQKSA